MSTNITWHKQVVNQTERWKLSGHRGENDIMDSTWELPSPLSKKTHPFLFAVVNYSGAVIWFTGKIDGCAVLVDDPCSTEITIEFSPLPPHFLNTKD
jgi:hypothetical protein